MVHAERNGKSDPGKHVKKFTPRNLTGKNFSKVKTPIEHTSIFPNSTSSQIEIMRITATEVIFYAIARKMHELTREKIS